MDDFFVYAYSGNVGHTSDQIDEVDPSVDPSVKDGVTWAEVSSKPVTFPPSVHSPSPHTHIFHTHNTRASCYWSTYLTHELGASQTVTCSVGWYVAGMYTDEPSAGFERHQIQCCQLTGLTIS